MSGEQYWDGRQQRGGRPYLRSRTPSFDNGDDGHLMGRGAGGGAEASNGRAETPADEHYYDPNYKRDRGAGVDDRGVEGGSSYYAQTEPTAASTYDPSQQQPTYQDPAYYQQPAVAAAAPTATYPPTSPGFAPTAAPHRTQTQSHHQPYNPANFQPAPQRNATISYGPSYNTGYTPAQYGNSPYPTYKPSVTQYASMPAARPYQQSYNPQYGQAPTSPTFYNGQYSPGLPPPTVSASIAASVYHTPPPPPPPAPPATTTPAAYNPSNYASPQQQPYQQYQSTATYQSTPFAQNATNQMFAGAHHSPDPGNVSPPSDGSPSLAHQGYHDYRHNSQGSASHPLPSPPPPAPPAHGIGTVRHPHSRPLPTRPPDDDEFNDSDSTALEDEQDALFKDVEAATMGLGNASLADNDRWSRPPAPARSDSMMPDPLFAGTAPAANGTNGRNGRTPYSDSDLEAEHGLEALRRAEEEDRMNMPAELGSDSDFQGADLSLYGGGYGGAVSSMYAAHSRQVSGESYAAELPGSHQHEVAPDPTAFGGYGYDLPDENSLHPFPSFHSNARVEEYGGLSMPSHDGRRMSYDEGDEDIVFEDRHDSDDDDDFPELFYHPHASQSQYARPLPSLPTELPGSSPPQLPPPPQTHSQVQRKPLPQTPDTIGAGLGRLPVPPVPRSSSLSSHTGQNQQSLHPLRSKTDAAINKRDHLRSPQTSIYSDTTFDTDLTTPQSIITVNDLPVLPAQAKRRKFNPEKLSSRDFKKCPSPWALSAISTWIREMADGESDLKEKNVCDAIIRLFVHYVPTMNTADAETLAARVVKEMFEGGVIVRDEEWVKFGSGQISGVMYQITGHGCYAPLLHNSEFSGRCYAHHCARTLKKIKLGAYLDSKDQRKEDWVTHWKLRKEDIEKQDKKEIERQNNLHEIVQTEEEYMDQLNTLKTVYQDQILSITPPIIKPSRIGTFVRDVFGKAEAVRKVNEEHLLPQLKFRQREQGPWISGFSDIFREWIRKARVVYIDYAANFPRADMLVRREVDRNLLFRTFLDQCRQDPRTKRLDWNTFLKGPITRLQRYSLLLSTVLKHTLVDSDEKRNLVAAIEEIKAVTLECDARVDEVTKKVALLELGQKLILRPGMEVNLRLEEKGREVILKGDLQRHGGNRFAWVDTHAILFDHYLILAKKTVQRDVNGGSKQERYDVSRKPIPMDLLMLESTNDDPVVRGAANRLGIGAPAPVRGQSDGRLRTNSVNGPGPGTLAQTNSNSSTVSAPLPNGSRANTSLSTAGQNDDGRIVYPFRIKHLGKPFKSEESTYVLYAPTAQNRQEWCEKIIMAKERHAASLHAQNAEPFSIKVLADCAFGIDQATSISRPPTIRGTPLYRAIKEVEDRYSAMPKPPVISRSSVNCATQFVNHFKKTMIAVGTDGGVFITEYENPRGWRKALATPKVTQIAVLEEFNLFLVLADKALVAFHLDQICPSTAAPSASSTSKPKPPQKLSGARDVGFFATGRMKERTLVFYKKREALSSTFKVLEPVLQKSTEKRSRWSRTRGSADFFREFDEFYTPGDCYGLNLFHSSLAIQSSKGFEVLTLDKKHPISVPELKAPHVADIAARVSGQKPLGMFRLSDTEFLLCYEECAVYCNKHGDVSRGVVMNFVGRGRAAAVHGPFLLVFDSDFIEVRNADNGRLRQVVAAGGCRLLDDGGKGERSIKVGMGHPGVEGRWLVVELEVGKGQTE